MGDFASLKAVFEDDFPGWTVWRSDAGRWYATLGRDLTEAQLAAGHARTVAADDSPALRDVLVDQTRRDRCNS